MARDTYWYVLITLRGLWFSRHLGQDCHSGGTYTSNPFDLSFSTPSVILSDNGAELRNAVVSEICSQFGIKQTFTAAYDPASSGLVERANRKNSTGIAPYYE